MIYSKFTSAWNIARFVAIIAAVCLILYAKLFAFGGFAPSLDVANTQDRDHRELHEAERERNNEDAHDRVHDQIERGEDPSDRDVLRDMDWHRDHDA